MAGIDDIKNSLDRIEAALNTANTDNNKGGFSTKKIEGSLEELLDKIGDGNKGTGGVKQSKKTNDKANFKSIIEYLSDINTNLKRAFPASKNKGNNGLLNAAINDGFNKVNATLNEIKDIFDKYSSDGAGNKENIKNSHINENPINDLKDIAQTISQTLSGMSASIADLKDTDENYSFPNQNLSGTTTGDTKPLSSKRKFSPEQITAAGIVNNVTSIIKEKPSTSALADRGIGIVSHFNPIIGAIMGAIKAIIELGSKQDRATSEFARAIGGGIYGKYNVGESVRRMTRQMPLRGGYTAEAAYSALTEIAEARGRTTERTSATGALSAIDLKRFGIGAEAISNFDTFGKSLESTDRYFAKLYGEVSKKGLSFRNVSKAVNDNLKAAQAHTFSNGLRGLEKMAERSVQLKYNMQQVFQFADKVSELEGAIGTAANLSVLGGTFAQFSDPMRLLYMGLNDMEGLQKDMENMFAGKTFWNERTQQMEMTAFDREMIKQASKAAGLDPNEMISLSLNEGRLKRIESQLGTGLGKDTVEYIKNIAELNDKGQGIVTINGRENAVSELTEADKDALQKESNAKNASDNAKLGDIYVETMSIGESADNILSYLQEKLGRWVFWIFQRIAGNQGKNALIAQGMGTEEERKMRSKLYDATAHDANLREGKTEKEWAKFVSTMSMDSVRARLSGLSPNGINPSLHIPAAQGLLVGPSHEKGGILGINRGRLWEAEGGEYLINKLSSAAYSKELSQIQNGTFNPTSYANDIIKNNMSQYFKPMTVQPNAPVQANVPNKGLDMSGTLKVDIPQTITINLAGTGKIGDYDISRIIMSYVDKIMKEASIRGNFGAGFNKDKFYNPSQVL